MKFLFLCHSLNIGGIETYILRFAKWLKQKHTSHELHLVCKSGEFGPYKPDFQETGVVLHSIPIGYFNPLPYLRFYRFLKHHHFDAICDFGGDFGAFPLLCASAANISRRVIFYRNARNAYSHTAAKRLYQSFLNRMARIFSTHILSNSQDAFDYYYRNYPYFADSRFQIIRNGIPKSAPLTCDKRAAIRGDIGILPDQKMVLHVGSGRWEKNHTLMFKMAKTAQDHSEKMCFCFAGPGVEENFGETSEAMELRNLRFLGERRDIYNLLQVSDIFLFPSLTEGQPNALLEAVTHGLPFIASNIAPIRESLSPSWGERWLFSPDDVVYGYTLLQEHLKNDFRQDREFQKLVAWCNDTYNQDKRFDEFLNTLTNGFKTKS